MSSCANVSPLLFTASQRSDKLGSLRGSVIYARPHVTINGHVCSFKLILCCTFNFYIKALRQKKKAQIDFEVHEYQQDM